MKPLKKATFLCSCVRISCISASLCPCQSVYLSVHMCLSVLLPACVYMSVHLSVCLACQVLVVLMKSYIALASSMKSSHFASQKTLRQDAKYSLPHIPSLGLCLYLRMHVHCMNACTPYMNKCVCRHACMYVNMHVCLWRVLVQW